MSSYSLFRWRNMYMHVGAATMASGSEGQAYHLFNGDEIQHTSSKSTSTSYAEAVN